MKHKFKTGDWCFFQFEVYQIKRIKDGEIIEVNDGISSTSSGGGLSDRCFPINAEVKVTSDVAAYWWKEIQSLKSINTPDIHRALVDRWVAACNAIGNAKKYKLLYRLLHKFGSDVVEMVDSVRSNVWVDNVKLFK